MTPEEDKIARDELFAQMDAVSHHYETVNEPFEVKSRAARLLRRLLETAEAERDEARAQRAGWAANECDELRNQLARAEYRIDELVGNYSAATSTVRRKISEINRWWRLWREADSEASIARNSRDIWCLQAKQYRAKAETIETERDALRRELAEEQEQLHLMRVEYQDEQSLTDARFERDVFMAERDKLKAALAACEQANVVLTEKLKAARRVIESATRHVNSFAPGTLMGSELNLQHALAEFDTIDKQELRR